MNVIFAKLAPNKDTATGKLRAITVAMFVILPRWNKYAIYDLREKSLATTTLTTTSFPSAVSNDTDKKKSFRFMIERYWVN